MFKAPFSFCFLLAEQNIVQFKEETEENVGKYK